MNNFLEKLCRSILYHTSDAAYAVLPKRSVLRMYGWFTNTARAITWRLACRYYGSDVIKYRGDLADFVLAEIGDGDLVIDVGCAEGNLTSLAATKARGVVGVDVDKGYIDNIDRQKRELKNVKFIMGDILEIGFKEVFDVAILVHAIEHMPDSGKILKKLSGISRKILVETPNPDSDWVLKLLKDMGIDDLGDEKHFQLFSCSTLKEVLEKNGWRDVAVSTGDGVVRAVARSAVIK